MKKTLLFVFVLITVSVFCFAAPVSAVTFTQRSTDGLGDQNNDTITSFGSFRGYQYLGTSNAVTGGEVWRSLDGITWAQVGDDGFGSFNNSIVRSMSGFNGYLYAGTENALGCQMWRTADGTTWVQSGSDGFGSADNREFPAMIHWGDNLYAGTWNEITAGAQLWYTSDGVTWLQLVGDAASAGAASGFGDANNTGFCSMASFGDYLYVGTYRTLGDTAGTEVWRSSDGESWTGVVTDGFGDGDNYQTAALTVFNGYLYAGLLHDGGPGQVWRSADGTTWTEVVSDGFGVAANSGIMDLFVLGQNLCAGTDNDNGTQLYRSSDGVTWTQLGENGLGDTENTNIYRFSTVNNLLLIGTTNDTSGGELWTALDQTTRYFAEGYTASDFDEYICIQNPNSVTVTANVTFMKPDQTTVATSLEISPTSRGTVNVKNHVSGEVSTKVQCSSDYGIVAERAMYRTGSGINWVAGHCSGGAPIPATSWYFAEGYTGPDFDEFICIQNPNSATATVSVTFMQPDQTTVALDLTIDGTSRETINVESHVTGEVSTRILSTNSVTVNAERVMYWNKGGIDWVGTHCSQGVTKPALNWYFAEGYTGTDFDEYICIQNPAGTSAEVTVTFMQPDQTTVTADLTISGTSRETVNVETYVTGEVSTRVQSTNGIPVVAERAMYWDKGGIEWVGGHCCPGVTTLATTKYFAEGFTSSDFDEYICIQNPNSSSVDVLVTFMKPDQTTVTTTRTIGGTSRETVNVKSYVSGEVSTKVESTTTGVGIVAERAMYWNEGGIEWVGGHSDIGSTQE